MIKKFTEYDKTFEKINISKDVIEESTTLALEIKEKLGELVEKYNEYYNKHLKDFSEESIEGEKIVLDAWIDTLSKSPRNGGMLYWTWDESKSWRK